jgi:hypothetical protein
MSSVSYVLRTGLEGCFGPDGREVSCAGSGQDAEHAVGLAWPEPRFREASEEVVLDRLTGLEWTKNANPADFPLTWDEALDFVEGMNRERTFGGGWRMPNRRELRSLISHGARRPALPAEAPFTGLLQNWYWTSTTSARATAYAWYLHMAGGRMFYGSKSSAYLLWPVRGESGVLPRTGQRGCFDAAGNEIECSGTGQDGELLRGAPWPEPRFEKVEGGIRDGLTGLVWHAEGMLGRAVDWQGALDGAAELSGKENRGWRLPNINELESLVDASGHDPALPGGHPFGSVAEACWSSTTSFFETDWAYVLYFHKGAVGVGHKRAGSFAAWPVRGP